MTVSLLIDYNEYIDRIFKRNATDAAEYTFNGLIIYRGQNGHRRDTGTVHRLWSVNNAQQPSDFPFLQVLWTIVHVIYNKLDRIYWKQINEINR